MTAYWTFGGTALLDTVGGYPEELARTRSTPVVLVGLLVIAVKIVGGLLALALGGPSGDRVRCRLAVRAGGIGSALLTVYGGLLVTIGALVLTGVLTGATTTGTGGTTFTYSYDARGNRLTTGNGTSTTQTLTYNPGNQISTAGYSHDGAGNLTTNRATPASPTRR